MWAMTNRHKGIAKLLLDNGASTEAKTTSGRTAFDFVAPDSDMSFYLSGYGIGTAGTNDDFYNPGFSQDKFEEELAENEMRRRMMMESARDLEVDLGNVGMDDQPEVCAPSPCWRPLFLAPGVNMMAASPPKISRKSNKSLIGRGVFTTRCSFSKRTSSSASSILSSPT